MGIVEKIKEIEFEVSWPSHSQTNRKPPDRRQLTSPPPLLHHQMGRTQKNKATEYHLGQLKAKLAKLRTQLQEPPKTGGSGQEGFEVQKYGDGRVALIGFPSVGKSTLLTQLTGTTSEVASYEFTTLTCIPGVIHYNNAKIQLLDLPGIIEGASEGKGRGRQVIAVCKSADMLIMVLDAGKPHYHKEILTKELESVGIRLNRNAPNISFIRKKTGGVAINSMVPLTHLDDRLVQNILAEYKIHNADILFKEDSTVDDLIDVLEGNRRYIKCLFVYNKIDVCSIEEVDEIARRPNSIPISCYHNLNLQGVLERIWDMMGLVRVYTKKAGHKPDFSDPVVLSEDRGGTSVEHMCKNIHASMLKQFSHALVWGLSSKHMPQRCGLSHRLADEDVVQIAKHKKIPGEEGRGRFRQGGNEYVKIADREKKKPLKS
jgi:uncharacterized protein